MIRLSAHGYEVVIAPDHGATILSADWRAPSGEVVPLLVPLDPADGFEGGCFVMAPFTNRIADGRFTFDGRDYAIPVNRPATGMAIHGPARQRAWRVAEATGDRVVLEDDFSDPAYPWRYRADLVLSVARDGIALTLALTNTGATTLPFGIGLHPWFPRGADTTLTFRAAGRFAVDARALPVPPLTRPAEGALGSFAEAVLAGAEGLDSCFADWDPAVAELAWRDSGVTATLAASGAFRHLHVYVPADRPVICAEPVSHLPDAINRPELGQGTGMTPLAPGEQIAGRMVLSARQT